MTTYRAVVASPHHLASEAGADILRRGGNAVDAAVATNLVLGVVTPYYCGPGGDLFAQVWDGERHALHSHGAAPMGATPAQVEDAAETFLGSDRVSLPWTSGMPTYGALPVTVPGATLGWFTLLEKWGTKSFGDLSRRAHDIARQGLRVTADAAASFQRAGTRYGGGVGGWDRLYGDVQSGDRWVQTEHADFLDLLAEEGPEAYYVGPVAEAIVAATQAGGSAMAMDDLAAHEVQWTDTLAATFRGHEIHELPPATQGATAIQLLATMERLGGATKHPGLDLHRRLEATRAALSDRERYLTDPAAMTVAVADLLDDERLDEVAASIRDTRGSWPAATPQPGGTAYLCAADADGLLVSLIQSNYMGFGSGVVVPGFGFGLQNRGAHFSLDPGDANVIAPGKRSLHTLIPGLAFKGDRPTHVFGTMGGDGQAPIHLQILERLLDEGMSPQEAVAAPRWVVSAEDGSVSLESTFDTDIIADLRRRGHDVTTTTDLDSGMGHAHVIEVGADGTYRAGADPRADSGVDGIKA